jgi:integrase
MKGTIRATVKVAGFQKERRFVKGTPARVVKNWKTAMRAKLTKRHPQPEHRGQTGTLAKDAERYYPLIKHLADWVSRRSEIRAWLPDLGETHRHMIVREDVLRIRGGWVQADVAAKTINNRVTALRNLFHLLDGDENPTPCDGVKPLMPPKVPPQIVTADVINRTLDALERRAAAGHMHAAADRARLMVLASTGKRPCEIERTKPADVDLRRRVWIARDAKGGFCPGVYLNDEMVLAWEAFVLAGAWGPFPDHFPRRLRDAGWPADLRPYNLRHSTWIEASERGNDLSDIQAGAGHKLMATTRRHYVPVLSSRMQRLSESLEGRFGWKVTA